MKLMTKDLEARFARVGSQEDKKGEAIVVAKFFSCRNGWTWYATEYDPVDRIFFGLVHGFEIEFGNFSMDEFESVPGPLGIERDKFWTERPIKDLAQVNRPLKDFLTMMEYA